MKNKLKSATRGSEAAATSQPKTNASKKKAANGNHTAGVVTCVLLEPNGREWARIKFPRDVFARIEAAARKLNITLPQFFENALLHYMELQMGRRSA